METASQEAIEYVTLLTAFQVVLNCQLSLKDSKYMQGTAKLKVQEAVNALSYVNAKNRNNIWAVDEMKSADMLHAIHVIGKQIASGDGIALMAITHLTRQGLDFSKLEVRELSERQAKNRMKKRPIEI
jgi:hypothetical protein